MKLAAQPKKQPPVQSAADRTKTRTNAKPAVEDNRPEAAQMKKLQASADRTVQRKENKTGLPDRLKSGVENLSGHSMDDVKVHYNSDKPAGLQAHAYAQGTDIHVAPGQEKHLPHEAWHVVQQKQGRVRPTKQLKEKHTDINDDHGLEREADLMGHKALQKKGVDEEEETHQLRAAGSTAGVVQRVAFQRISGSMFGFMKSYTKDEQEILDLVQNLGDMFNTMEKMLNEPNETGRQITHWATEFEKVENATLTTRQYPKALKILRDVAKGMDELNNKIAGGQRKYGSESRGMVSHSLKHRDDRTSHSETLFTFIGHTLETLPKEFHNDKSRNAVTGILDPGNSLENGTVDSYEISFAVKQAKMVERNLNLILERLDNDWERIQEKFGLQGTLKQIHLTGSDLHKGGQQVVIVEDTQGKKVVYKPRSTSPDSTILGAPQKGGSGLFHKLNEMGKGKIKLPTMKFMETEDEHSTYSYVEHMEQHKRKTVAEAQKYYYTMGQLAVAGKMFGMKDLHQDNVMSTRQMPTIIDAETALQPFTLNSKLIATTEITLALEKTRQNGVDGNNRFIIAGEEETWQKMSEPQRKVYLSSFEQFTDHNRKQDLKSGSPYRTHFLNGIKDILSVVKKERPKIIQMVMSKAKQSKNIRVVPVSTSTFRVAITDYHSNLKEGIDPTLRLPGVMESVVSGLQDEGFYKFTPNRRQIIVDGLRIDLKKRDYPIFHFEPSTNQLIYHGRVVGNNRWWTNPQNTIAHSIDSVLDLKSSEIVAQLGLD